MSPTIRAGVLVVAACCALAAGAFFDDPSKQTNAPTIIKDTVEEVSLNLTIHDRHGKPVTDLSREELHILDDGKPVQIREFRLVKGGESQAPRMVSFVFESVAPDAGALVRDLVSATLRADTGANIYFSLWQINGGLQLIREFTRNREVVEQTMSGLASEGKRARRADSKKHSEAPHEPKPGAPEPGESSLETIAAKAVQSAEGIVRDTHTSQWMAGLLALIQQQAVFSGRKEIFFFSEGLRGSGSIEEQLRMLISRANRAGVSVYTVDTSGVNLRARLEAANTMIVTATDRTSSSVDMQAGTQMQRGGGLPPPTGPAATALARGSIRSPEFDSVGNKTISDRESVLRELATKTGGRYVDLDDFHQSVHFAAEDLQTFYEVTYKPAQEPLDGHFRPITVTVSRPHAVVENRAGYFASASIGAFQLAPFELALAKEMEASNASRALLFNSRIFHFGSKTGVLSVQLPLSAFQFREDPREKLLKLHFAILALIVDSGGRVVEKLSEDVPYELAAEKKSGIANEAFSFERPFLLPPGDYRADIAVADRNANTFGANSIAFSIPKSQPGLALSDMVLVRGFDQSPRTSDRDPLRYGSEQVTPELSPAIDATPGGAVPIFLTVYPNLKAGSRPALDLEILHDGKQAARTPMRLDETAAKRPTSFVFSLNEEALPSGRYVVIAKATQGGELSEQRVDFTLVGSTASDRAKPQLVASKAVESADLDNDKGSVTLLAVPKILPRSKEPSPVEIEAILEGARQRALDYKQGLPNFLCIEITRRYADPTGHQAWRQQDVLTELLRYQSGYENYETLHANGQDSGLTRASLGGVRTSGEFGELLDAVFSKKAAAQLKWEGESNLNGSRVYVFKHVVTQKNSIYVLATEDGRRRFVAGFHGFVYIDANAYIVRQISVQADDIPADFPYRDSAISVTYDYISIGGNRYVLPTSATLVIRRKKHSLLKNEMQFTEYRRFTASSNVTYR